MTDPRVTALWNAAFGTLPERLVPLVRPGLGTDALIGFEASLVVPFGGGPIRLAAADPGDPAAWSRAVLAGWPHRRLRKFLELAPASRRMIDTDGTTAEVFLDDLQQARVSLPAPRGFPLMCLTLAIPSGEVTCVTHHEKPPFELLQGGILDAMRALVDKGATGKWGVRWRGDQATGFVWVSESRWRGNAGTTRAIVESYAAPPAWERIRSAAESGGLAIYPDAIDVDETRFDVTVGVVESGGRIEPAVEGCE